MIDSIGDHIIDPLYDKPLYTTNMDTNGPFPSKTVIVPADLDSVKRYNEITLNLKYNSVSTVLHVEGEEMYVFGGFNEISGSVSSAKFKLIYPPFGISFVGVFGTNDDTDYGKYILNQGVEDLRAGTYTLRPNGADFTDIKFIGVQLSGSWGGGGGIYVKFELSLDINPVLNKQ